MARSKINRSRLSNHCQQQPCTIRNPYCKCVRCVTERNLSGKNSSNPASLGHRNEQDVMDSIAYHWKILSSDVKTFLLQNSRQLNLKKIVNFWREPQRIDIARAQSCASSISGSSWFLALNYMFVNKLDEARALILHGSFMQECVHRPIEHVISICDTCNDEVNRQLRIYRDACIATQTRQSMEAFLHKVLPPDYRRRMSFACQSGTSHSIVNDYISIISNDWNGASSTSAAAASKRKGKGVDNTSIELVLMNSDTLEQNAVNFGASTMLKSVFNNYADEQGVSLRSLRFTHNGKILFLSSAGNKTAEQLGIRNLDTIHISSTVSSTNASPSSPQSPKKKSSRNSPSKLNKKSKGKGNKIRQCASTTPAGDTENYEEDKIQHSKRLTRVFEEAQSVLKSIRQRLNSLNIERTLPKQKRKGSKKTKRSAVMPICNPPTAGTGGKAGKSHFVVQVGESCNLYKTTKHSVHSLQQQRPVVTDLHGLTKEEALAKLDSSLPEWTEAAMKGSYPFVIPVKIICGGGNQVLSEVVENWVRMNANVSNAPKNLYAV